MQYFKNKNNEIFAYDDEQVKQGYGKDLIAITEAEAMEIASPPKTPEELEAQRVSSIKAEAGKIILERYPEYKQRNATLGIYEQAYVDEMTAFISNIKNQSDALELDSTKTKDDFVVE